MSSQMPGLHLQLQPKLLLHWTLHAREKMRFYRLSEQRVKRIIHSPKRIEEGIAPKTIAMMQPVAVTRVRRSASAGDSAGRQEKWKHELWVMVQDERKRSRGRGEVIRKVISAWRYPGVTKPRSESTLSVLRKEYSEYSMA